MTTYSVDLDLVAALATPSTCPTCGSSELVPDAQRGVVTFACSSCARVWYAEAGVMVTLHRFPVMRGAPLDERIAAEDGR